MPPQSSGGHRLAPLCDRRPQAQPISAVRARAAVIASVRHAGSHVYCHRFRRHVRVRSGWGTGHSLETSHECHCLEAHRGSLRATTLGSGSRRPRTSLPGHVSDSATRRSLFLLPLRSDGQCHVAVSEDRVVGWCDILPSFGESRRHVGTLGIGLLPEFRDRGIGRRLLQAAISTAWARGLSRIELTVREDNLRAKALYERMGFENEGVKKRSMLVDGKFYDCFFMALLRRNDA